MNAKKRAAGEPEMQDRQPSTGPDTAPESAPATGSAVTTPEEELAALRREVDVLRDENLRLLAEVQNAGKRAEREKQESLRYAEASFAKDLLPIIDDLERTLEASRANADVKTIAEGVRMLHEHFLKALRARQIEPIEAAGQPFDPQFHEALLEQPSDEHARGTVMQEVARGYKMYERVLRPARTIVSSGPPAGAGK
jgi:molecular chaperone GrpE